MCIYSNICTFIITMKQKNEGERLPHSSVRVILRFFRSFQTVAAEDAGGVGPDSGADAARTERDLLILPQLPRRGGEPGPRGNKKKKKEASVYRAVERGNEP